MSDWAPPRCIHGHIILGCPHDDCPTQGAYLDQHAAALREWERRLWPFAYVARPEEEPGG